MTDSLERRRREQPGSVICAGNYVLRRREWGARDDACQGNTCPHPLTCTTRHRNLLGSEEGVSALPKVEVVTPEMVRRIVNEELDKREREM